MFTIPRSQSDALRAASLRGFEQRVWAHLRHYFPRLFFVVGEPAALDAIRHCIRQAIGHGIKAERDICLYVTLGFLLGTNFEQDMLLPWARETILERDNSESQPKTCVNQLRDQAYEYLYAVCGHSNRHLIQAVIGIRRDFPYIMSIVPEAPKDLTCALLHYCIRYFPQKFHFVGKETVTHLIQHATAHAERRWRLCTPAGQAFYTLCSFYLGSAFESDPLAHRLIGPLRESMDMDPALRVHHLCTALEIVLNQWLSPRFGRKD